MNAALRAVVRMALHLDCDVYAIYEGYQGMIDGGDRIAPMRWNSVGGIMQRGGTIIGSARCLHFREREGRLTAAYNLVTHGIDRLVIIGGDGSLTGANILRKEWSGLLADLVEQGRISAETAARHEQLTIAGLVGSIDNDMSGTDMTIGADTALHRITNAIDAISSTAASHQRSFVVEVMGRNCGYLTLMSAIAGGADWALIPESPPNLDAWEDKMCDVLRKGREIGRRDSIVVVAEGAIDRHGNPISSNYVKQVIEERLGEDTRLTILGHVQRGGSPTVYDRNLSTVTGAYAVEALLDKENYGQAFLIGINGNEISQRPLMECIEETHAISTAIAAKNFEQALDLRGTSFKEGFRILRTLVRALPREQAPRHIPKRFAVLNAGAPAPGMNQAVRTAVRLGVDSGQTMLGVNNGFRGLVKGDIREHNWMSVNGWMNAGGSFLGTNRYVPTGSDFYAIARNIEEHQIDGLLVIGGWNGYLAALELYKRRETFPAFNIPIVCLPATIDNDLPGSELSIGADTALNSIISAVDKIKQSAVASRRVFVVEVMGRHCGYLALMSALSTGAERVYLPEEGVTLGDLEKDLHMLRTGFSAGKRMGMMIRNESANEVYTTAFMAALFQQEGEDLYDVRTAILGHLQQGGDPSPFDRIQAARLSYRCINYLIEQAHSAQPTSAAIGMVGRDVQFTAFENLDRMMDKKYSRPKLQWWLRLRPIARVMAQSGPNGKVVGT
jgi:6-phosphofructokinase 1